MADPQEAKPEASSALPQPPAAVGGAPSSSEPAKGAVEKDLPVVEAPKLDGSEVSPPRAVATSAETPAAAAADERAGGPAAAIAGLPRFALLAAGLALAAALGSFVGSLSATSVAQLWSRPAARSGMTETSALQGTRLELAEFSALKASLDGVARSANSQFAKIADRLDRVERAASEPTTRITHIAEAIDRLEKKSAAAAAAAAAAAPETTGALAANEAARLEPKIGDRVLEGWIVADVRGSRALVESRYGGVFLVSAGSSLPGLGRVEAIKRQDGQWVVITARGLITSGP